MQAVGLRVCLLVSPPPCGESLALASLVFDCKETRVEEGVTPFGPVSLLGKLSLWIVRAYASGRTARSPTPCKPGLVGIAVEMVRCVAIDRESEDVLNP